MKTSLALVRLGLLSTVGLVATVVPLAGLQLFGAAPAGAATPLVGTFSITAGSCAGGAVSGTYLRMVLSGGTNQAGPYFSNSDSSCSDNTYTPLSPGTAGGLVTGTYQPEPSPAFDGSGNALANAITTPVPFEGVRFATATNATDPQTGVHVPVPSIVDNGGTLSGSLQAFGVSWNKQEFNQGSPKPDGSSPGNTTPVTGSYDAATGAYDLQWSSQVVGGPFNGFSAFWNLTGRFVPAARQSSPVPAASAAPAVGLSPSPHSSGASGSSSPANVSPGSKPGSTAAAAPATSSNGIKPMAASPDGSGGSSPAKPTRIVLSSHTIVSGGGGWNAPTWLIALVALAAIAGVVGILLSERALRRVRPAVADEGSQQ